MVMVKFCGLTRPCDIDAVNELMPDYVGFVFWKNSRRYITPENALSLRKSLHDDIITVGVFVDESPRVIADMADTRRGAACGSGVVDIVQLHGHEDSEYISHLRTITHAKIIQAFRIKTADDVLRAEKSMADFVLLDAGMGTGKLFDWSLIRGINRPYFLAGGLDADNVKEAVKTLSPYAVDVSSGIETDGHKDRVKMSAFISTLRREK